jgi:glycosyltransferase involved in cell wall biosynthesis
MAPSSLLDAINSGRDPYEPIARHAALLSRLEDIAEAYLARGQYDDAVATVGAASQLAEIQHPGLFASPRLEAVLEAISRDHLPPAPAAAGPASAATPRERVLIVVTETYATGGHTRMVWRWIGRDPTRVYSVASTAQRGEMPDGLRAAVAKSGGEIFDVPADASPLARAAALRSLAAAADLIVLIDHPDDPIPALALAGLRPRPPIVMFNHCDNAFWIGRGIVDVLMCIREEGVTLAARRGFPASRVLETPHPVAGPDGQARCAQEPISGDARASARAKLLSALDWPQDTVLLATVGTHYKWEGPPGHRLLDLIEPVLAAMPQARLLAAGARDEGRWAEMRFATGGRVLAAGVLEDGVGELLTAADIYLESRPLAGTGSSAEAAAHGLPVLAGASTELERPMFTSSEGYGATCVIGNDAYRELLARLIAEPELRRELGEKARRALAATDEAWEAAVERAFALARELGPIETSEFSPLPEPDERDVIVDWKGTYVGRSTDIATAMVVLRGLIAAHPALRGLYASLEPRGFRQIARAPAVFATPPTEAGALRTTVATLRLMTQFGVAERYMIALPPEAADSAVPVLQTALAEGPDFELELALVADPILARPPGSLAIAA